jgi:hypothetical protein
LAVVQGLQIWDANTGGTMLWQGTLQVPRTVLPPSDTVDFPAGALTVGLS